MRLTNIPKKGNCAYNSNRDFFQSFFPMKESSVNVLYVLIFSHYIVYSESFKISLISERLHSRMETGAIHSKAVVITLYNELNYHNQLAMVS